MSDEHVCGIFRREEDKQVLRDFVGVLQDGGIEKLRDAMQLGQDYRTVREIGFRQAVKAVFSIIGLSLILGLGFLIAKLGVNTVTNGQ